MGPPRVHWPTLSLLTFLLQSLSHTAYSSEVSPSPPATSTTPPATSAATSSSSANLNHALYLRSVTLYTKHNWFFAPHVYLRCVTLPSKLSATSASLSADVVVDLPEVNSVMRFYNFSLTDKWQPIIRIPHHDCVKCGVFQHQYLQDSVFANWQICETDFTHPYENGRYPNALHSIELVKIEDGEVRASFECPTCNLRSGPYGREYEDSTSSADDLNILFWLAVLLAIMSLFVFATGCLVYCNRKSTWRDAGDMEMAFGGALRGGGGLLTAVASAAGSSNERAPRGIEEKQLMMEEGGATVVFLEEGDGAEEERESRREREVAEKGRKDEDTETGRERLMSPSESRSSYNGFNTGVKSSFGARTVGYGSSDPMKVSVSDDGW